MTDVKIWVTLFFLFQLDRKTSFSFSRARGPGEEIIEKGLTICSMYHWSVWIRINLKIILHRTHMKISFSLALKTRLDMLVTFNIIRQRNSKAIHLTKIKIGGTWLLLKKLLNGRELLKLSLTSINHGSQLQPSEVWEKVMQIIIGGDYADLLLSKRRKTRSKSCAKLKWNDHAIIRCTYFFPRQKKRRISGYQ